LEAVRTDHKQWQYRLDNVETDGFYNRHARDLANYFIQSSGRAFFPLLT